MKNILIKSFLALILFIPSLTGFSQVEISGSVNPENVKFERISREEGLPDAKIHCILQDSKGFLWFGTSSGLVKFDGYNMTVYKTIPHDPNSLSHPLVWSLFEDRYGNILIGTSGGGLNKFNPQTEKFKKYAKDLQDSLGLTNQTISAILEDQTGNLWIGTEGSGLFKFLPDDKQCIPTDGDDFNHIIHYQHDPNNPESLSGNTIRSILEDKYGNLWIGTFTGLNKLVSGNKNKEEKFIHFKHNHAVQESLSDNIILSLYEDNSGYLWIGTARGGLNKFIPANADTPDHFIRYQHDPNNTSSLSNNTVYSISEDNSGNFWVGTNNGLNKFIPEEQKQNQFILYRNEPIDPNIRSAYIVMTVLVDKSGIIWIGTWGNGIFQFNPRLRKFSLYKQSIWIWAIYEDSKGILWLGTNGSGLRKFDRKTEEYIDYKNDPKDPESISHNKVWSILEDRSGTLWIGTDGGGLNKLIQPDTDSSTSKFINYRNDPNNSESLSHNSVFCLFEDKSGMLWIGTLGGGLNKFDPKTQVFSVYMPDPDNPGSSSNLVSSIYEDHSGTFWIGTFGGGLSKFDPETEEFIVFGYDPHDPISFPSDYANAILEDKYGNFWVASGGGGLVKIIINENEGAPGFKNYTTEDGLPDNILMGLLEDDRGNLWMSTWEGLSKFNPRAEKFDNFTVNEGLQDWEFNYPAYFKSKSGELFFGGVRGFNAFYPDEIKDNSFIPPVEIIKVSLFNKPVSQNEKDSPLEQSILYTNEIELSFKQNFLSFEFVALNYSNPEKNQYKYRMIELDTDTVYAGNRRFADYPDMKPGKYTFWVTGSNNDGVWNENGRSINIIIHPPWYKANLAFGSYGVLFFLSLFGFINWRTQSLKKDKEVLEGQVKDRTKEIEKQKEKLESTLENLKITQTQLVQSEKMASLGGLVAGVAHEINTPVGIGVTAVSSLLEDTRHMAELYKKEQISRGDFKEFLQTTNNSARLIQKNLDRTAQLVQSFKQVSVDQSSEEKREFLFMEYLEDVIRSLYPKFKNRDIRINIDCNEKLKLNSFPGVYAQIFTNLVLNSITHGFPGEVSGQIDIHVKQKNKELSIEYKDNGKGIPKDILPRIFDPFFTTDQSKGTGLGLNIVYNLVTQKLNGTIKCDSKDGKGVVFGMMIPLGKNEI